MPSINFAQSQKYKGYPRRGGDIDVLSGFQNPLKDMGMFLSIGGMETVWIKSG